MRASLHRLRLNRSLALAALPAAILLAAPAAMAQQAGTYTGTNDEGDTVQVVVAAQNGGFAVTGMSDGGAVYCKGTQLAVYGVAIGLSGQPITGGVATVQVLAINLYYASTLTFSGSRVSGKIEFAVPVFDTTATPPKKACAARTKKQHFTATFGGAAMKAPTAGKVMAAPLL